MDVVIRRWRYFKLSDLCEFKNGLWKGKKPPYIQVGVIRNTNFTKDGRLDDSNVAHLEVEEKQYATRKLRYGDLLLEKSGGGPKQPVGRIVIFDKRKGEFSFSNFTSVVRIKDRKALDFRFLHWYLHHLYLSGATETMQKHSTNIRNLQLPQYKSIDVPLPSRGEQKRIVAILDEAFAGIETAIANTEKILANVKEMGERVLERVISASPTAEEALVDVVDDDCSLSYGIVQPGKQIDGGMPVVRPVDLGEPIISTAGLKRIDPEKAKSYERTRLRGGELLLCVRGTTGTVSQANEALAGGNVTRGIVPIRFADDVINQNFGYFLLRSAHVQSQIREKTYGAALMQINIRDLRKIRVRVPPLDQQARMVDKLRQVERDLTRLETNYSSKLSSLAKLKRSLLHRAFSGELTADSAEREVESATA